MPAHLLKMEHYTDGNVNNLLTLKHSGVAAQLQKHKALFNPIRKVKDLVIDEIFIVTNKASMAAELHIGDQDIIFFPTITALNNYMPADPEIKDWWVPMRFDPPNSVYFVRFKAGTQLFNPVKKLSLIIGTYEDTQIGWRVAYFATPGVE